MDSNLVTRPAGKNDFEAIRRIALSAWSEIQEGYREYINNDDLYQRRHGNWQKVKAEEVRLKLENDPQHVLVTEADGRIVAFTTFKMDTGAGIGEILNNAVDPEFQGRGIGKLQHLKLLEIFRRNHLKYATVLTGYEDKGHAKARASYEKVGFKKMHTTVVYSLKL